jgi:hypothetical protein
VKQPLFLQLGNNSSVAVASALAAAKKAKKAQKRPSRPSPEANKQPQQTPRAVSPLTVPTIFCFVLSYLFFLLDQPVTKTQLLTYFLKKYSPFKSNNRNSNNFS